ncbi:MAG: phasin family protein [Burkholderiaceae bacterium]
MSKPPSKTIASKSAPTPARKQVARKVAPKPDAVSPRKNILTAGIKALTSAHEEAVARQSRVFESLLGLGPKREAADKQPTSATALDPFGFRKFEDVFDQRVAKAIENLGIPSVQAFAELTAEVERLRETVVRLEAQGRKR